MTLLPAGAALRHGPTSLCAVGLHCIIAPAGEPVTKRPDSLLSEPPGQHPNPIFERYRIEERHFNDHRRMRAVLSARRRTIPAR